MDLFGYMQVLEEEKIHNLVTIGEYPLYMIPLDEDVLSFELDLANKVWPFLSEYSFFHSSSLLIFFFFGWT